QAKIDSFTYTIRNSLGAVSNEATVTLLLGVVHPPDHTAPVPTITTTATNPTNLASIPFTVTFSENVTNFGAADVTVTNGTLSGFTKVNDKTFTFNVAPTADGAVTVNVAANVAEDAAGNGNAAATKTITSDRAAPAPTTTTTA